MAKHAPVWRRWLASLHAAALAAPHQGFSPPWPAKMPAVASGSGTTAVATSGRRPRPAPTSVRASQLVHSLLKELMEPTVPAHILFIGPKERALCGGRSEAGEAGLACCSSATMPWWAGRAQAVGRCSERWGCGGAAPGPPMTSCFFSSSDAPCGCTGCTARGGASSPIQPAGTRLGFLAGGLCACVGLLASCAFDASGGWTRGVDTQGDPAGMGVLVSST